MKRAFLALPSALLCTMAVLAQTPDDLVESGRCALVNHDVAAAHNNFTAAVSASPRHEAANFFQAATRLLMLPHKAATSNLLTRLGFPLAGRDIYNWTSLPPTNQHGHIRFPANVSAAEVSAHLKTVILPEIHAALTNLSTITNTGFLVRLNINETVFGGANVDYADVILLRAILSVVEGSIYEANSQNCDVPLALLQSIYEQDGYNVERLLQERAQLLTTQNSTNLELAKAAYERAADLYLAASALIRQRPAYLVRLFNLAPEDLSTEEDFRKSVIDFKAALGGRRTVSLAPQYQISLIPHFSGAMDFRILLPAFKSNGIVLGTLPDATFGGTFFGTTAEEVENLISTKFATVPVIEQATFTSQGGHRLRIRGGAKSILSVEASTNLVHWTNVAGIYRQNELNIGRNKILFPNAFYRAAFKTQNPAPPANDNFTDRFLLEGDSAISYGYLEGATSELGEPVSYPSVWWKWIGPTNGVYTIQVRPSKHIGVFQGNSLNSLTLVGHGYETVTFVANKGTEYQISVDTSGWTEFAKYPFKLTLDRLSDITWVQYPQDSTFPGIQVFEVRPVDADSKIKKVVYSLTCGHIIGIVSNAPYVLQVSNITCGSYEIIATASGYAGASKSTYAVIFIRPINDNYANRLKLVGVPVKTRADLRFSGVESQEPGLPTPAPMIRQSVWYSWTAPSNGGYTIKAKYHDTKRLYGPSLSVFTGIAISTLTLIGQNNFNGVPGQSQLSFTAVSNVSYSIRIGEGYWTWDVVEMEVLPSFAPEVSLAHISFFETNGTSVIRLSVDASDADGTVEEVAFYADEKLLGSVSSPPYIFQWNDWHAKDFSSLNVRALDDSGVWGIGYCKILKSNNDMFSNPEAVYGGRQMYIARNVMATKEPGEPNHAGYAGGRSLWWHWVAPESGPVTISTTGSDFDTLLGVYTGSSVGSLTVVAADDDSGGNLTSQVTFHAIANTAYRIAVDAYNGAKGNVVLRITQ